MLPIVFPQITDLLNFEGATALPELVPEEAAPAASFSMLLGLAQDLPLPEDGPGGQILPMPGNALPVAATPAGETEITIELPDAGDSVAIAAVLLPAPAVQASLQPAGAATEGALAGAPTALPWRAPLTTTDAVGLAQSPIVEQPVDVEAAAEAIDGLRADRSVQSRARRAAELRPVAAPAVRSPESTAESLVLAQPSLQPLRELRRPATPASPAAVAAVEPDAEVPVTASRQTEVRNVPPAVELRPPGAFVTKAPERLFTVPEPQVTSQAQPAAAIAAQATALRQPAADIPTNVLSTAIDTAVSDPEWGEQLASRVQIMASNRLQTAEIRLSPAELGPVRVQISVDDAAATVTFQAQHAVTREAIEQALPRLREMLAENGLTLSQTSVGEHGGQNGSRESAEGSSPRGMASADPGADGPLTEQTRERTRQPEGLVDTFA